MDKKPTDMTLAELDKAVPNMSDADLQAAYAAEKSTEGHKARDGAIGAYEKAAKDRGVTLTDPEAQSDAELASETPGAQPAGPSSTDDERDAHAETIRSQVEAAEAKAADGGEVTREEILALHRKLEALANHLNFRLPA